MEDGIEIRKIDAGSNRNNDEIRIEPTSGLPHFGCGWYYTDRFILLNPNGNSMKGATLLPAHLWGRHAAKIVNSRAGRFLNRSFSQYNFAGDFCCYCARGKQTCQQREGPRYSVTETCHMVLIDRLAKIFR